MITHLTKIPLFIFFFNVNYFNEYKLLVPLTLAVFLGTNFGKKILNMIPEKFSEFCRDQSMAMLFCYFNQIHYFKEYLASYEGKCIILIGPVK